MLRWIIKNQLGRRNLTPEQLSYLRGTRYNLEKRAEGRPEKRPENQDVSGRTVARLAEEYHVSPNTIEKDGQFAEAMNTLETEVRQEIRQAVLKCKNREDKEDKSRVTKRQGERTDLSSADTSGQNAQKSDTTGSFWVHPSSYRAGGWTSGPAPTRARPGSAS